MVFGDENAVCKDTWNGQDSMGINKEKIAVLWSGCSGCIICAGYRISHLTNSSKPVLCHYVSVKGIKVLSNTTQE